MRYMIAVVCLLMSASAFAQQDYPRDLTLSWTNPSAYEGGAPIEAGDLETIRLECFRSNDTVAAFTAAVPDTGEGLAQSETFVAVIPSPGTYRCYAYAIVVGGAESQPSNEALKKYTGKPLPPQTFK